MEKKFQLKVVGLALLFVILLLTLQNLLQCASSRKHFYQSADIMLHQIDEILERNEKDEENLVDSLKNDYIIRAQACSYIIERGEALELNVWELRKIANLLEVDEIHLFNTEGEIYSGTNPEYYGYSFDSGEQMAFFKPMLSNRSLSMCQDVVPNTAEGKMMMYAIVWREDQKGMLQIGLTPTRLLKQMERNQVSDILSGIPTSDNIYFLADCLTGKIVSCTQEEYQGRSLQEIGFEPCEAGQNQETLHFEARLNGEDYLAAFLFSDHYRIGICQSKKHVYEGVNLGSIIVLFYLLFASTALVSVISVMTKKERAKEKEYQTQLEAALQQAKDANEAKSVFLFNMSHDIRTPMNAIIGFTDLLEKNADDQERREDYIAKIKSSSTYLLELINNVLEMARIERGKLALEETIENAEEFHDILMSFFREDMERKRLSFHREIQTEHPDVWCDPVKLREIFMNIMSNAVKYTPEGGSIALKLSELPSAQQGYVVYKTEIEDTGIGMPKEFLSRIFEEFTREKNTTQSGIGGTGLGMAITKKLVDLMGGTITVESRLGKGTKFTVMIPHRIAQKDNAAEKEERAGTSKAVTADFKGRRILLAEDNDLNAEISMEILSEVGFELERAEDGATCIDMVQKAPAGYYDVILMDIQMPNMNGYEATERIRMLEDEKKDVPILAMTANAFEEDRQNAMAVGMNGHIAKPVDVAKLIALLAEILK